MPALTPGCTPCGRWRRRRQACKTAEGKVSASSGVDGGAPPTTMASCWSLLYDMLSEARARGVQPPNPVQAHPAGAGSTSTSGAVAAGGGGGGGGASGGHGAGGGGGAAKFLDALAAGACCVARAACALPPRSRWVMQLGMMQLGGEALRVALVVRVWASLQGRASTWNVATAST